LVKRNALVVMAVVLAAAPSFGQSTVDRERRLEAIQAEIDRLGGELRALGARERTLLGEIDRLGVEIRLSEAERERVEIEIESVSDSVAERRESLVELERLQSERRRYLAFRLREIYKQGARQVLRRAVGGSELDAYVEGLRYAAVLSSRDARILASFRTDADRLSREEQSLAGREKELRALHAELSRTSDRLSVLRRQRAAVLEDVRSDKASRERALEELSGASQALADLADSFLPGVGSPRLDMRPFRGLLDWPAEGPVSAGFGTVVHPRFRTRIPHPGLDIEAPAGAPIRSVFDGRVVFASWMRGYGLTSIIDHGGGLLSIYAHGAALLVEPGEEVLRGQQIGMVGETGSLRGPYLYFELRDGGEAVDPLGWLRGR
jgi:septal ring factor EnvC (AmiA/AmiB activator)